MRTAAGADAVGAIPGVESVLLDVTDAGQVGALAAQLDGAPLAGLVNNAGIAVGGPLEELALDDLRRQFEVNVFACVAVAQAALPSLRIARGRIVNVGSIGGRVGTPFLGAYAGSKGAIRVMSASLRRELRPWGIWVACVEPGAAATEIWRKGAESTAEFSEQLSPAGRERYGRAGAGSSASPSPPTRGFSREVPLPRGTRPCRSTASSSAGWAGASASIR